MEVVSQRVDFPRESTLELRGTRFIVAAFFDDVGETLETKVARLLQNDVENMASQV